MAIDRWLFDQCAAGLHPPAIRFYEWSPAAISLGYHQRQWPSHWETLSWNDCAVEWVRRPTGGRAVLHARDLTYCIVLPGQTGRRRETYQAICQCLIEGWRSLGVELQFGDADRGYQHQSDCFQQATAADLTTRNGEKFIGSAQAWRAQTVLQHGSMQLNPDVALYKTVFGPLALPPSGLSQQLPTATIIEVLTAAFATHLGLDWQVQPLNESEWAAIQALCGTQS